LHASLGAVLPRPLQAIQVALVHKAFRSRAEAEAALPRDVVLPYLVLIGRVRLFREREPATQLRAKLDRATLAKDTDAIKQLDKQLESLGFDERVHVPTANELCTQIRNFVSAHYDRAYEVLVAAKKFDEAAKCKVLFEELMNEQAGLGGGGHGGGGHGGGGHGGEAVLLGGGGGGPFIAPKLGGSDRDMFYAAEQNPPMGGPTGFSMGEWNRLRDLLYLTGHPYFKLNSAHPLAHVSLPVRPPSGVTVRVGCVRARP
jgi:hypothetical protein